MRNTITNGINIIGNFFQNKIINSFELFIYKWQKIIRLNEITLKIMIDYTHLKI